MPTLDSLFDQFLRERTCLKNVSPKTRVWYESAWKAFKLTQPADLATREIDSAGAVTRAHLSAFVVASRDRGLRPVTVNTWLRALNAYCRWLHQEGVLRERVKLPPLRVERRLVKTLDEATLRALLNYNPIGYSQWLSILRRIGPRFLKTFPPEFPPCPTALQRALTERRLSSRRE